MSFRWVGQQTTEMGLYGVLSAIDTLEESEWVFEVDYPTNTDI